MQHHSDLDLLQGSWLQVAYERDGVVEPVDQEAGWQPKTTISGQTFVVTIADGSTILAGEFKLDSTSQPKTIEWIDKSGPYASDQVIRGIYHLTATEFMFCASYDGRDRPTEFTTKRGEVLRRMTRQ